VNVSQYSFYLCALYAVLDQARLRFTSRDFPYLGRQYLYFEVAAETVKRVYLDAMDGPELRQDGLGWCDVYGKINLDWTQVPAAQRHKVIPLGVGMLVRVWSWLPTCWHVCGNYRPGLKLRPHLRNYWGQLHRFRPETFVPVEPTEGYVYGLFPYRPWYPPETNQERANFVEACSALPGVTFEGGFDRDAVAQAPEAYRRLAYSGDYHGTAVYLEKTRRSLVVFVNAANDYCHSTRLGEGLALGKAVIMTPPRRELPAPLVHGEHVHVVDGSVASMRDAVERIRSDAPYRRRLQENAAAYYRQWLHPAKVMERVLATVGLPPRL
jgi:hypothetical protein